MTRPRASASARAGAGARTGARAGTRAGTGARAGLRPGAVPGVLDLLDAARRGVAEAVVARRTADRYAAAHLAALRAAAAVLAARTHPAEARRGPRSAWALLAQAAPELAEWAGFFAAGAGKRAAAEAGLDVVTQREADDLLRDAETFLALVDTTLGLPHQPGLPQVS